MIARLRRRLPDARALAALALLAGCAASDARAPAPQRAVPARGSAGTLPAVQYPLTARTDHVDDYHGVAVADPYHWLEDDGSEQTAAWVREENALTESVLARLPQREPLRRRLAELWNSERLTPPVRRGDRWIWTRNDGLQAQDVLETGSEPGRQGRVLLDPNTWSEDGTLALEEDSTSDDGRLLAYCVSEAGSDWRTLHVRDLDTGQDGPDALRWIKFSTPAWSPDGAGFYYGRFPAPAAGQELSASNLNMQIAFHRVGEAQEQDVLVHARPDEPTWNFSPQVSDDGAWLVLSTWRGSANQNLLHVRPQADASAPWVALNDGWDTDARYVGNDGATFYLATHLDAPNRRVVAVDLAHPERAAWRDVVPEQPDALRDAQLFRNRLVLTYMHDAHDRLALADLHAAGTPGALQDVPLPGLGTISGLDGRRDNDTVYVSFSSFTQPGMLLALDIASGATRVQWRPEVRFDPDAFVTEQVLYASRDGTRVPMFLVHRRDVVPDGNRPTYLFGYGGFNIALTPTFNVSLIPFLEQGGLYAQPNLRGGGEYGEDWHRGGMLENKQNVFDDFIAAAEWLQTSVWTRPERLAIAGRSNGGLLVGAALTQRPELFGCALPTVGVMDMLRYQRFTIGRAWVPEYGSSDDESQFPFLRAYSPLQNIRPGTAYPPTLVMTADHDDRVVPAHSFKFGAALQAAQSGSAPVLIRIDTRAGHGSGKPVAMRIAEAADTWAFTLAALGPG